MKTRGTAAPARSMGSLWAVLAVIVLVFGCGDDSTTIPPQPVPWTWIGTFADSTTQGAIVIDVVQTGDKLAGEVVFGSPASQLLVYVRGTVRSSAIHLELDTSRIPYQYTFTLDAGIDTNTGLTGSLALSDPALDADLTCRALAHGRATAVAAIDVPYIVRSMAFDGTHVWLSTTFDDYVRMNVDAVVTDTVVVFYELDHRWTSDALAADGSRVWGFLPETILSPGGSINTAQILGFDAAGQITSRFRLWHRPNGLAYDGSNFWSLRSDQPKLVKFDPSGTLLDSVLTDIPDAYHLEFDAGYFWSTGWYLKRLYKIAPTGEALAIYDLPEENNGLPSGGIARVGTTLWYAQSGIRQSTLYKLSLEP